jgi:hypothetical protein
MNGKSIVVIGALAAGAYLLLSGSGIGGGAEGSGSKKATAITGINPTDPTTPSNPTAPSAPTIWDPTPTSNQAPFQPSPYLLGLIAQKYAAPQNNNTVLTPMSKKESSKLWSRDSGVSTVLSEIQKQGATVYTAPTPYDNRMVDYYVEIGGNTGLQDVSKISAIDTRTSLQQKMGVVLKPSSSSSSSTKKSSGNVQGVRNIAQSGSPGGWGG